MSYSEKWVTYLNLHQNNMFSRAIVIKKLKLTFNILSEFIVLSFSSVFRIVYIQHLFAINMCKGNVSTYPVSQLFQRLYVVDNCSCFLLFFQILCNSKVFLSFNCLKKSLKYLVKQGTFHFGYAIHLHPSQLAHSEEIYTKN